MKPYDWYEAGLFCAEDEPLFAMPEMETIREPWAPSFVVVTVLLGLLAFVLVVAFALSLE